MVFNASSILFALTSSPSTSEISSGAFFNSWNRAIIVFKAVPAVSGASRVVSPLYRHFHDILTLLLEVGVDYTINLLLGCHLVVVEGFKF